MYVYFVGQRVGECHGSGTPVSGVALLDIPTWDE